MTYVFGPVPSRRLGRSLGVDLVPFKTCTYDCIYCQLGRTTCRTSERKEWVPLDPVLRDIEGKLAAKPDYITLSGSGEPTLYSRLGELIAGIKALTKIPVAVLTNGSLLWQEDVQRQLMDADLVIPSLDAGSQAAFAAINRPLAEIAFERMLGGLIEFRRVFKGGLWLEVFLLDGYATDEPELASLIECAARVKANRIQLNTVTRPPAEDYALAVGDARLAEIAQRFSPPAEVVADFEAPVQEAQFVAGREEILALLRRRPCTIADIAAGLRMHRNEVVKYVQELTAAGLLSRRPAGDETYYTAIQE